MDHASLSGGFTDPPQQSAVAFRGIMQAMARPGMICDVAGAVPPAPLSIAAGTALLTLCDPDTGVHLAGHCDAQAVRDWITFQTGAPLVAAEEAQFVVGAWSDIDLSCLQIGTPEYPDRSATVIVAMTELRAEGATLTGPGIKDRAALNLPDVVAFQRNAALFPLGLDFMFTCGAQMAALPRSTKVI
ncbi:phosphonate C-P lyase system protein PhnH [Tateyamaria omphalii]|uniref:Phosphonate C-P lyase system protein PhnH n=1 Tax=Tateyamaria omphalii TaxID=299262 RepID=A0A1P8MQQ4_9RHOB|nr:phosphonate C-P lyase system protein PhnH [Tateyamaria omphalii]APX10309.1 phosphonate C-P lyase system protein PhnH [Tateyamaria omphalii]